MRVPGTIQNWPIQRKLLLIILTTIVVSLVLVMAGIFAYELTTYRIRLEREITGIAGLIAANSAPTLAFDDQQTAQEILDTLKTSPAIAAAALYTNDGRIFASYARSGRPSAPPPITPGAEVSRFSGRNLELVHPIQQKGRRLGTLYLRADMANVYQRLTRYASIFLVVALAIGGGAFLLQRLLQRLVSEPLLRLSMMAERIAGGDLTAHVPVESADEIGQLGHSFNHMSSRLAQSYEALWEREEQLRESETTLRLAIEATGLGTFDFYPGTGELIWSELARRHFGLSPDAEVTYEVFLSGLHHDDREWVDGVVQATLRPGSSGQYDIEYRTVGIEDGKERWLAARGQVLFDDEANPTRFIGTTVDITQRRVAEQERERLILELERSNRELQQFAYVSSHDLQEPLRTVTVYAQLLQKRYQGKLGEKGDKYLNYMFDAANRMSSLITDLLAFSRVGSRVEPFQPVEMESVLKDALTNLKVSIKESGAEITHAPLPQVEGDRGQLTQLLQNLIANGLKYQKKDAAPRVSVSVERQDDEWVFGVHDNGIGIDPQFYDRIFIIFQRLHKREEYSGTGMGLAICRKIVEQHGGRIWVESRHGQGSSFYFSLPVRKE